MTHSFSMKKDGADMGVNQSPTEGKDTRNLPDSRLIPRTPARHRTGDERRKLTSAIQDGDLAFVRACVAEEVESPTDLLPRAAMHGHVEMVKELLELGADVSTRNHLSLVHAAAGGYYDIVVMLVKAGASPNVRAGEALRKAMAPPRPNAPVERIGERGQIAVMLLDRSPVVPDGPECVLSWASVHGAAETVRHVMTNYPGVHAHAGERLVLAAENDHVAVVRVYFEFEAIRGPCLGQALSAAVAANSLAAARTLLELGVPANAVDGSSLDGAARSRFTEMLELLVAAGQIAQAKLDSALRSACNSSRDAAVKLLLKQGANPNFRRGEPLHIAAFHGNIVIVRMLLEAGANPRAERQRALRTAIRRKQAAVVPLITAAIASRPRRHVRRSRSGQLPKKVLAAKLISALNTAELLDSQAPGAPITRTGRWRSVRYTPGPANWIWACGLARWLASHLTRQQMVDGFVYLARRFGLPAEGLPGEVTAELL